jgi:hypothetical protein
VGEKTFIWYGAWDLQVGTNYEPRGGVGLATLPRDRFGSLSPRNPGQPASFITKQFHVEDQPRVFVNAAGLSDDALLRVELLDDRENPIPAFSGDKAAFVRNAGFRSPVVWEAGSPANFSRKTCRIQAKFEGRDRRHIELFAVYIESGKAE